MASPTAKQSQRSISEHSSGVRRSKERSEISPDPRLVEALRAQGQRVTRQRAAVYAELAATRSHPTAVEVYEAVRRSTPGISLATVYKTLEVLVRCGLTTRLALSDDCARYDGQLEPHLHGRCDGCGRVFDLHGTSEAEVLAAIEPQSPSFAITGIQLQLTGQCSECSAA